MFSVGVPQEIKTLEKRVGLTPEAVKELTREKIEVFVEKNAGIKSGFSDTDYEKAGATVVGTNKELYARSQIIQKVKEPLTAEFSFLRHDHILFCFLHLASQENCALTEVLMQSKCTAIGFETLRVDGKIPLLAPMSQIAGGLSASYSAMIPSKSTIKNGKIHYEADFFHEMEQMASAYPHPYGNYRLGHVIIFGAGVAGKSACEAALQYGAKITFIEKNDFTRKKLQSEGLTVFSPDDPRDAILKSADVLIGCAHVIGQRAGHVLSSSELAKASKDKTKVIMDISIDQGGNFPESHSTNYSDSLYIDSWGNRRFAVPNIPSLAGKSTSIKISEASLFYTRLLARHGVKAFEISKVLAEAINVSTGKILIDAIRKAHCS